MRFVQITEDSAGNRWCAEFEPGSTTPVRQWVERLHMVYTPCGEVGSQHLYITDYQWEFMTGFDNLYPSSWNCWGP